MKYLFSLLLLTGMFQAMAQTDKATTLKIVTEKNFVFRATTAIPLSNADVNRVLSQMPGAMGGSTINLNGSQYDLMVTKDSVVAYLPYYGRAFNAPMNPNEGGIKFTSKNFSYKESKNKKGMSTIQIITQDVKKENYRLTLNISTNGYANLMVFSVNKQPITFNGYLSEPEKPKN